MPELTFIQTVLIMSHESGASLTIDAIGDFIRILFYSHFFE